MKRIYLAAALAAVLAGCSAGTTLVTTNYNAWQVYDTNQTDPSELDTVTVVMGQYSILLNSGLVLEFTQPADLQDIMTNYPMQYLVVSNTLITPADYRDLYLVVDGDLFQGPSEYLYNTTQTNFTTLLNTYALPNGAHTVRLWLKVFYGGKLQYIPGQELTLNVTNQYLDLTNIVDPAGDDTGLFGDLTQPPANGADGSYLPGIQDITNVRLTAAGANLKLILYMDNFSTAWSPPNGFDHVCFNIYLDDPDTVGATHLSRQWTGLPAGLSDWDYQVFGYGWGEGIYSSSGSSASVFGTSVGNPDIFVDETAQTVTFLIYSSLIGSPTSLSNWSVFISTFDFDGISTDYRRVGPVDGASPDHQFHSYTNSYFDGDGVYTNALILDWVGPFTIQ